MTYLQGIALSAYERYRINMAMGCFQGVKCRFRHVMNLKDLPLYLQILRMQIARESIPQPRLTKVERSVARRDMSRSSKSSGQVSKAVSETCPVHMAHLVAQKVKKNQLSDFWWAPFEVLLLSTAFPCPGCELSHRIAHKDVLHELLKCKRLCEETPLSVTIDHVSTL